MSVEPSGDAAGYQTVQLFNTTTETLPISQELLQRLARWVGEQRGVAFEMVEMVFVDAETIVEVNRTYLEREYVTDVISFRLDEGDDAAIEGTVYCCVPRIREQAEELGQDEATEFVRIAVHGLLHLAGMDDQSDVLKAEMTRAEDEIITIWKMTSL